MVDLIHLCSKNSVLPFTPDELRALAGGKPAEAPEGRHLVEFKIARRLGKKKCDELIRRYEAGETAQFLATEFGVSKSALLVLFRSRNVVVRRQPLTEEQVTLLAIKYEDGKTVAELEAATGIAHATIQRALKKAGIVMRPRAFNANLYCN